MKKLLLLVLCLPLLITPTSNAQDSGGWHQVLRLGKGTIHDVTWSPDAESIAVSTTTGAWIYDSNLENERQLQPDETVDNYDVVQNPVGEIIWKEAQIIGFPGVGRFRPATRAYLWDAASGEIVHIVENATGPHLWKNDLLITLPTNGLNVWSTNSGEQLLSLELETSFVIPAYDGERLLAASNATSVLIWDIETGEQINNIAIEQPRNLYWQDGYLYIEALSGFFQVSPASAELTPAEVNPLTSPDGTLSAELVGSDTIIVREGESERFQLQVSVENRFRDGLGNTFWSADGSRLLASTGRDIATKIYIWDSQTGELIREIAPSSDTRLYQPVLHPSENMAIVASLSGDLQIWNLETGDIVANTWLTTGSPLQTAFSPDNTLLATARALDNSIRLWNLETGKPAGMFVLAPPDDNSAGSGTSVAFSPDGTLLAAGGQRTLNEAAYVNVWDLASGELLYTLQVNPSDEASIPGVISIEWSADGSKLLTHTGNINQGIPSHIREWDASTGELINEFAPNGISGIFGVRYFEDEILLYGVDYETTTGFIVRSSELPTLDALPTTDDLVVRPFFDSDVDVAQELMLTMDADRTRLEFWDINTVTPAFTVQLPEQSTHVLAWQQSRIANGAAALDNSSPPMVQLWEVDAQNETAILTDELTGHSGTMLITMAFNADATLLATTSSLDEIIIWARD